MDTMNNKNIYPGVWYAFENNRVRGRMLLNIKGVDFFCEKTKRCIQLEMELMFKDAINTENLYLCGQVRKLYLNFFKEKLAHIILKLFKSFSDSMMYSFSGTEYAYIENPLKKTANWFEDTKQGTLRFIFYTKYINLASWETNNLPVCLKLNDYWGSNPLEVVVKDETTTYVHVAISHAPGFCNLW